jgi:hypothetical protein
VSDFPLLKHQVCLDRPSSGITAVHFFQVIEGIAVQPILFLGELCKAAEMSASYYSAHMGEPLLAHWMFKVLSSSQVKLLITNNAFCIVKSATAQSKTFFFRDYGVVEAPPGFQDGWSDCMYFFFEVYETSSLNAPCFL